jgi:hypothetical protein
MERALNSKADKLKLKKKHSCIKSIGCTQEGKFYSFIYFI